jgi:Rps23 Pro-64 3,4-dihydroxylase Tpa1-like proline 4-hydroxylase
VLELALTKHHDAAAYAGVYQQRRRIHIPDLLEAEQAAALHSVLSESSWNRVINSGQKVFDITPEQQASLSEEQNEELRSRVLAAAREHYQFSYENHRLSERGEDYHDPAHPLFSLVTFLNSAPLLRFVRRVTGAHDISFADAQATRFGTGDFLHIHDDVDVIKKRRLAYVLNLTRRWSPEWGGILNFVDDDGHISEGYAPCFNALNVFEVGVRHFVSYVAPFAGEPRISVTGWFRAR